MRALRQYAPKPYTPEASSRVGAAEMRLELQKLMGRRQVQTGGGEERDERERGRHHAHRHQCLSGRGTEKGYETTGGAWEAHAEEFGGLGDGDQVGRFALSAA